MAKCNLDCFNCSYPDCVREEPDTDRFRWCNRPEKYKQEQLQKKKEQYKTRKEKGLCVHCGKPATHGVKCYEHYIKAKRYNESHRSSKQETWKYLGKCYFCGRDVLPGKKSCAEHYEILRKNGKHMSESEGGRMAQQKFINMYRTAKQGGFLIPLKGADSD